MLVVTLMLTACALRSSLHPALDRPCPIVYSHRGGGYDGAPVGSIAAMRELSRRHVCHFDVVSLTPLPTPHA